MAEARVKIMSSDGTVYEANARAMMAYSNVLKDFILDMGTDATIPLSSLSSSTLRSVIEYCETGYNFYEFLYANLHDDRIPSIELEIHPSHQGRWYIYKDFVIDTAENGREIREDERTRGTGTKQSARNNIDDDRKTHEDVRSWEEKEYDASFINKVCSKFDWEAIKDLHEAADYLNIKSLLFLTSTLISQAPSKAFLGVVSPWLDYKSVEGYHRRPEVAVC